MTRMILSSSSLLVGLLSALLLEDVVVHCFSVPPALKSSTLSLTSLASSSSKLSASTVTEVTTETNSTTTTTTAISGRVRQDALNTSKRNDVDATTPGSSPDNADKRTDDILLPGKDENVKFNCDPSVEFWREFQRGRFETAQSNVRNMVEIATRFSTSGVDGASYFGKHLGRSAYFIVNALLGNAAFDFHERFLANRPNGGESEADNRFSGLLSNLDSDGATRLVLEALICYEQDYEWIRRGTYKEPWDMQLGHRQSNPINVVTQTSRFIRESVGTLVRRKRATLDDKKVAFFGKNEGQKSFVDDLYPEYYQNAFHYQTDGWMSSDSANVYETSTETLFLGRQDSMQRSSLPPIIKLSKKLQQEQQQTEKNDRRPMRVLEVACGTGRFMTFLRDNLPLDTECTALDLSPFYLEKARDNDSYWRRQKQSQRSSNASSSATTISPTTFVQGQAEKLPFDDESFDAVVCIYLFHEIPREVRKKVAREMARVCAPGGTVVFTDSIQKGDRPLLDPYLGNFEKFNEPYYGDYIVDRVSEYFIETGLVPETKIVRSTTKSLAFTKGFKP